MNEFTIEVTFKGENRCEYCGEKITRMDDVVIKNGKAFHKDCDFE